MTAPDFRSRLETLLGETNTVTRAAAALGCDRRSVYRWLDPEDPAPVPEWAVRHVETVEAVRLRCVCDTNWAEEWLPEVWWPSNPEAAATADWESDRWQKPPPP